MNKDIKEKIIKTFAEGEYEFDNQLRDFTSFKLGGPCDIMFIPKSSEDIKQMVSFCREHKIDFFILGRGSNLLVSDSGYRGAAILISTNMSEYEVRGDVIWAQAGILLSKMANVALSNSLSGFEFASGIPGTLGGAIFMNAGAYGGEIKDVIVNCEILTLEGEIVSKEVNELDLAYRSSNIMKDGGIVLSGTFKFKKGDPKEIKSLMQNLNKKRKNKQPLELPSAGSTFKRPTGYYAGKLIMDSGLGGFRIGGASVSSKHCGFIVNDDHATSNDVVKVINHVKRTVKNNYGVDLECEVRFIGDF